ncbi:MAG: hypothetical protein U0599_15245 [Vicinamibacteria bacterium]
MEDAPAGIEGARRAGMPSIGVLSGHHPRLAADLTVPSLAALPDDAFETARGAPDAVVGEKLSRSARRSQNTRSMTMSVPA